MSSMSPLIQMRTSTLYVTSWRVVRFPPTRERKVSSPPIPRSVSWWTFSIEPVLKSVRIGIQMCGKKDIRYSRCTKVSPLEMRGFFLSILFHHPNLRTWKDFNRRLLVLFFYPRRLKCSGKIQPCKKKIFGERKFRVHQHSYRQKIIQKN